MSVRKNSSLFFKKIAEQQKQQIKKIPEKILKELKQSQKIARERILAQREFNEHESMRRFEAMREQKKINEIKQKMLRELNLREAELGQDRRISAMSKSIYDIYRGKITTSQIKQVNKILFSELGHNSPVIQTNHLLRNEIQRMRYGRISERGQAMLTHTIHQILEHRGLV